MKARIGIIFAAAALLTAVSSTASADQFVAETSIATSYPLHHSYDAVSDRNALSEWNVGGGWQFDQLGQLRGLVLFQTTVPGRLDGSRFGGDLFTEWGRQRVMGLVEWGPQLLSWLRPFARGGVGYAHQFLSLDSNGPRLKDHAHDLAATASGGLDLSIPFGWGALGLGGQFGYLYQTPATFDELRHDRDAFEAEYEPDDDPWTRERADFGSLKTNGVFWDVGVHLRFAL
jgi:hypothetical protein